MFKLLVTCFVIAAASANIQAAGVTTREDSFVMRSPFLNQPAVKKSCERCNCGERNKGARVVGGTPASVNAFPWLVRLLYHRSFGCGGSLLNDRYVVSAAHCVKKQGDLLICARWLAEAGCEKPKTDHSGVQFVRPMSSMMMNSHFMWFMFRVVFGEHDRCDVSRRPHARFVTRIVANNFTLQELTHDIALLQLAEPITYSHAVRPVCLPKNDYQTYEGSTATVAGWGATAESGKWSCTPLEAQLPILSNTACQQTSYNASKIKEVMMCAGYPETAHRDACTGDSGGPLVHENRERGVYELIGVVSWGYGCARKGYPGVYTRVTKYLDWIRENTEGSCYCTNNL